MQSLNTRLLNPIPGGCPLWHLNSPGHPCFMQHTCQNLSMYFQQRPSVSFLHPFLWWTDPCSSLSHCLQEALPMPLPLKRCLTCSRPGYNQSFLCINLSKHLPHWFATILFTCSSHSLDCNYPTGRSSVLLPAESKHLINNAWKKKRIEQYWKWYQTWHIKYA